MSSDSLQSQNGDFFELQKYFFNCNANICNDLHILKCQCIKCSKPCVLIHGTAGNFNDALIVEKLTSCKKAASMGYQGLLNGADSIKAVEMALWWLECDEFFNCGYGSVLNEIGDVQMDACIINGSKLECGSIAAVSDIEHPISLAKYVLENFPNSIIIGETAKQLAKNADLKLLSKEDTIAPAPYLAYKMEDIDNPEINWNIASQQQAEALKKSDSAVGCIAYDGHTIAAGSTSGGLHRKLVGTVGNSALLGCGAYANQNAGCILTGDGDSIMKLSLSRVISDEIEAGRCPWQALQKNLDDMLTKYNHIGGGIALKKSGECGVYFTSNTMPYAIVANDCVTFGTTLNDKQVETYVEHQKHFPCRCTFSAINNEGISDTKLFSFREWQRYIECRRTVLVNSHFPTKLKYDPHIPDVNNLYIKFLESVHSKTNREEPEITTKKHLIPRELVNAMYKCISDIKSIDTSLAEVNIFFPSLTPLHSYLQHLLRNPLHDLPRILRNDFSSTKVGYMTKPELTRNLALQQGMCIDFIDTNLHFLEKNVPLFEQAKIASIKDLKDNVAVQDVMEDTKYIEEKESLIDYLHDKKPCQLKIDAKKKEHYDNIQNTIIDIENYPSTSNEFIFDQISPTGELLIPTTDDNDIDHDTCLDDTLHGDTYLLSKFCKTYGISLTNTEKEGMFKDASWKNKRKPKLLRNKRGQFVKQNDTSLNNENLNDNHNMAQTDTSVISNIRDVKQSEPAFEFHEIDRKMDITLKLFKPFKDYWMYHCNFSRVKPKNFALLEKTLPRSFRWLLNECASVIEMPTEDLYEEVCLVEAYYANVSEQFLNETLNELNGENRPGQAYINAVLNKW